MPLAARAAASSGEPKERLAANSLERSEAQSYGPVIAWT